MHKRSIGFVLVLQLMIAAESISAQNYEKVWFDKSDSVFGYYIVIKPLGARIQGAIVLLDGYGGDAISMLPETKIQNVALVNDLLTVCIPSGANLFLSDAKAMLIKKILNQVAAKFDINKKRFAVGGFSSGGTIALRYAELSHEHPSEFEIQPAAVFAGDSPTDLMGLYESSKRESMSKKQGWWSGESRMIIDSLDKNLGPLPGGLKNYRKVSPFLVSDSQPGNEKWIVSIPFRTYHDVDPEWQLKNRGRSIYNMNMLNASELVRRLQDEGNTQAEFIESPVKGRRSNGQMHPHSWNIIDETDLIYWIREKLDFFPGDLSKKYFYSVEGWQQEVIEMPFDFAPAIPYKGFEDLRFAPGWGKADSDEKWAYTLVWWLDKKYSMDENSMKQNLESYFSGLTKRRAVADRDDLNLYFPSTATVRRIVNAAGDELTFNARIHIYDAQVTKKPAELFVKIHYRSCSNDEKTVLLFEVSGFSFTQPVWAKLDKINAEFECSMRP